MDIVVVSSLDGDRPQYRLGDAVLKCQYRHGQIAYLDVASNPDWLTETILCDYLFRIHLSSCDPQWSFFHMCRYLVAGEVWTLGANFLGEQLVIVWKPIRFREFTNNLSNNLIIHV